MGQAKDLAALLSEHVRYMPRTNPIWAMCWKLYLALRRVSGGRKKIFESRHVTRLDRIAHP